MKTGKLNSVISISIILLLFSCNSRDPLSRTKFGKISPDAFFFQLIDDDQVDIISGEEFLFDSIFFFNINEDSMLRSVIRVNTERKDLDSLYSLKLNFGSDSVEFSNGMLFYPGEGLVSEQKLNSVLRLYKKWYGEPDLFLVGDEYETEISKVVSIIEKNKMKNLDKNSSDVMDISKSIDIRDVSLQHTYFIWMSKNFNLMIGHTLNLIDSVYISGFIKYEHVNLTQIIQSKEEQIRNNASLNDYVFMKLNLDSFSEGNHPFTDRLNLSVFSVKHSLPEEPRNIKKFKFEVIIEDEYKDTLLVVENFEFDGGVLESAYETGYTRSPSGIFNFYVDYDRYNEVGKSFENLRRIRDKKLSNGKLKDFNIKYNIKSIVFENGDVLK